MKFLLAFSVLAANVSCSGFTNLTWKLTRHARIEGNLLIVDVPKDKAKEGGAGRARIDMSEFSGECYSAHINASAENISEPETKWGGMKFMFHYKDQETGKEAWINSPIRLARDFPLQTVTVSDLNYGRKLDWADLVLGLEGSSGRVVFDLSTLAVDRQDTFFPKVNQEYRVAYPEQTKNRLPLRGVMLPTGPCTEDDFRTLHEWGATLARYQMTRYFGRIGMNRDIEDYDRWLEGKLDHLEHDILPWAAKYGVKIVVDLHSPPGGREPDKDWTMYYDEKYAKHFIECWRKIATRFKRRPEIYGFDLVNEPMQRKPASCDYWTIQKAAAEVVRQIDPDTPIIIESNMGDSASAFAYLSPLAMDNVIYQVHMYAPLEFTHQQLPWAGYQGKCAYPDKNRGWGIEFIRDKLRPVREFEKAHGARIYVGEFSAASFAEGAVQYIADCIAVFEEYGWDWTYHAFREDKTWSVEHEPDGEPGEGGRRKFKLSDDNPRKRVLLKGLKSDL